MAAAVIVTYNSADVISACLKSCITNRVGQVLVVDNASEDQTVARAERFPGVRVIRNSSNLGFAAAVNQGVKACASENILLLNPDVELLTSASPMETALKQADVAAVGGLLVGSDGNPQHGFGVRSFPTAATLIFEVLGANRLCPSNPVNRNYRKRYPQDVISDVDQPAGAFLMFRRSAWSAVGGFDPGFFPIWFEDVDFCKRLREKGFRILLHRAVTARHAGGHSARQLGWQSRQRVWYGSLLRYASKHFSVTSRRAVCLAVLVGVSARSLWMALALRSWEPIAAYAQLVRIVGPHLRPGDRRESLDAIRVAGSEHDRRSFDVSSTAQD